MIDISTHRFTVSDRGLFWLTFLSIALVAAVGVLVFLITAYPPPVPWEDVIKFAVLIIAAVYGVFEMYCHWMTYLYAADTTLEIDMMTHVFTFRHKSRKVIFKPTDVAHWYWDTGLHFSRVSANHSVIVLKSGEELPVYCWLFEGNHFFLSDYNRYNACYFISTHEKALLFPDAEPAPRYKYLFPPEEQ